MTEQREKPGFVVGPSGTVEDVRRVKHRSSRVPPSQPPGDGVDGPLKSGSPQHPKRVWYVIPIPIGLIIFLLVSLIRCVGSHEDGGGTFDSESALRHYQSGNRYLFSGDYDQAIFNFTLALHSEPDNADIYNGRGLAYEAKDDHNRALSDFNRALELAPDSALVCNNRAITYLALSDFDRAITDLDRAIEFQPNLGKAYYNRGLVYLAQQDYDRAIADLDLAIQHSSHWSAIPTRQPTDSAFSLLSGFAEQLEAQRYAAPLPSVHYNRALAYFAMGERDSAIADLQEALQLQPDFNEAQTLLEVIHTGVSLASESLQLPTASSTEPAWSTPMVGMDSATATIPARKVPAVDIAVYVPQPGETWTTPVWDNDQPSCQGQALSGWSAPGTYLYAIARGDSAAELVAEQMTRAREPTHYSCDLLGVDITSPSHRFGESLAGSPTDGTSRTLSGCLPQGALGGRSEMSITVVGTERTITDLGVFEAVQVDVDIEYSITTGAHRSLEMVAHKSEWYACGYGLIHSTASAAGKESGRNLPLKSSKFTLLSYTPITTNESRVRYILIDAQLSGNIASYRAEVPDEETAEALRRWDAGVRVANIEEFERAIADGQWHIVYAGTRSPILGTDVILTSDVSP